MTTPAVTESEQANGAHVITARALACGRVSSAWQIIAAHINKPLPDRAAVRIRRHLDEARRLFGAAITERHPKHKAMPPTMRASLKAQAFAAYGGRCACCGETDARALTIDHVEPLAGRKVRGDVYRELQRAGFPRDPKYQPLCLVCNLLKGTAAECPHQASGLAPWLRRLRRWYEAGGANGSA
jgi:hypothetical protein